MDKIKKDSFILMSYIDKNLCEDIIQYYKDFEHRATSGKVFYMNETNLVVGVDASIKDSLDLHLDGNRDLYLKFHKEIGNVLKKYKTKYPHTDIFNWGVTEPTNIQYYKPGGGYKIWHCERAASTSQRGLVFMTYLNDVKHGGTEFHYQKLKIKAKKGCTLIWPSDWTHTHRGIISGTDEKYIITGWISYT
jgi:hypothetical protein